MTELVAIGECLVELMSDGPIDRAEAFTKGFGGDTCDAAIMATRLGTKCAYVSRVGDDAFGDYLIREWRAARVDISAVARTDAFTGLFISPLQTSESKDIFYYRRGSAGSMLQASDLPDGFPGSARIVHLSGVTQALSTSARKTILDAARRARDAGARVSFDVNYRPRLWPALEARKALDEIIPFTDIVLPSTPEDTLPLLGIESPEDAARYFRNAGVPIVAVKAGARGAYVEWDAGSVTLEASEVDVVDASGAGDAFAGALLHCLIRNATPEEAGRVAIATAELKVSRAGAVAGLPSREEVERALPSGMRLP